MIKINAESNANIFGQMAIDSIRWRIRKSLGVEVMGVFFGESIITFKPRCDARSFSFSVSSTIEIGGVDSAVLGAELTGAYTDGEISALRVILSEWVKSQS